MKTNTIRYFALLLIFGLLLTGCDAFILKQVTPTIDFNATQTQNAMRTEAAITVAEAMTEVAAAEMTSAAEPSATASERPTATATSTVTETPQPTTTSEITSTSTPEPTITVVIPTMTTQPVDYRCSLVRTEPFYKAFLSPGEDFDVHWVLENSGTETWYHEFISGKYRNGTAMHRYSDSFPLNNAVKPGETYEVFIDMQAPWDPGEYSAIWTLNFIKTKKAFCWFSVDIVVK